MDLSKLSSYNCLDFETVNALADAEACAAIAVKLL